MHPVLIPAGAPMRLMLGKGSRIAAARGAIWLTIAGLVEALGNTAATFLVK
jgi:hypothetical protein